MKKRPMEIFEDLFRRHPNLEECRKSILEAQGMMHDAWRNGRKLLCCGNGGSAADAKHVVSELMKSFRREREMPKDIVDSLAKMFPGDGEFLSKNLEPVLPAVSLSGEDALFTAFSNDVNGVLAFAQQVYGIGNPGDVLLGISTSGNSMNVVYAMHIAAAIGVKTVLLSGRSGGKLKKYADVSILVPEDETYLIQELHLPIYHAMCAAAEAEFFEGRER